MNMYGEELYTTTPYEPQGSNYHDERCSCPSCMPDEPNQLTWQQALDANNGDYAYTVQNGDMPAAINGWGKETQRNVASRDDVPGALDELGMEHTGWSYE